MHTREQDLVRAADYYRRCLVFSETVQLTSGYYVFANTALARLVAQHQDVAAACRYYEVVVEKADKHEACYRNARAYLSHYSPLEHPCSIRSFRCQHRHLLLAATEFLH